MPATTTEIALPCATETAASRLAGVNFNSNLSALAQFQSDLVEQLKKEKIIANWVFARDGYLTTRSTDGFWHTGCSIPLQTARELLKKLEVTGTVGCFLNPSHAAQIRAAFEKLQPVQAILAVVTDFASLETLLHCDDFSTEIAAGRLLFATGSKWLDQLRDIFEKNPGLPLPQQFLRTPLLDDAELSDLSTEAQNVISAETSRRAARLPEIVASAQPCRGKTVVLAGSRFNLGDLSNIALRQVFLEAGDDPACTLLDPDYPLSASPLALAEAAADADALVAADTFRCDLPNVVSTRTAWVTWVTSGRIASCDPSAPRDALLLAEPAWRQAALGAGWKAEQIQIAAWPQLVPAPASANSPAVLGLLTDTVGIEIPQKVKDFSSQLLLWEYIEEELANDPLALGDDPDRYLDSRKERLNIRDEGFERPLFFDRLISPAYKRGLALFLLKHGIRIALFGSGWNEIPELKPHAHGPIKTVGELGRAISICNAILQPFPAKCNPMAGLPLPYVSTAKTSSNRLLNSVRPSLSTKQETKRCAETTLNPNLINLACSK